MEPKKGKESKPSNFFATSQTLLPSTLSLSKIKHRVIALFSENRCSKLQEELKSWGLSRDQIDAVFLQEGEAILGFALSGSSNEPIDFLKTHISLPALKEILLKDNFSMLRCYLAGERGLEEHEGWCNQETEKSQIEKFKFFLSVDADAVSKFMTGQAVQEKLLTDKVKINYQTALNQFEAESAFSSKSASK
jgi:hypothetical protein